MPKILMRNPEIRRFQPRLRPRLRLFCFPYAGGGASIFYHWSRDLPVQVEVCALQFPGREELASCHTSAPFSALIDVLLPALLPYLDMPFAFFGHSMGALVSFECARLLAQVQHRAPARLFVSAYRAPQLPISITPPSHQIPDDQLIDQLRQMNILTEEIFQDAQLVELLLSTIRADLALCETYIYAKGETLTCPISAFAGLQDDTVSYAELHAWREQTRNAFKLRMLPGDHFFINHNRSLLLRMISQDLQAQLEQSSCC